MGTESNIQLFGTLSTICLVIAILAFLLAVFFFFFFDIPAVFALKTGRAKKKTLDRIQKQNSYTDKIGKKADAEPVGSRSSAQKVVLSPSEALTKRDSETVALGAMEDTSLLRDDPATSLLSKDEETSLLFAPDGETSVLAGATNILSGNAPQAEKPNWPFEIFEEVIMIHTKEMI